MFGKLMKYELKSCLRTFVPLWCGILALSVINGFTLSFGERSMSGAAEFFAFVLPLMLLFGLTIAVMVLALVVVLQRYYQGLLGEEGYLMFTLPVNADQLVGAKLLTATILEFVSAIVAFLGIMIVMTLQVPADLNHELGEMWREASRAIQTYPQIIWLGVEFFLLVLVGAIFSNLRFYSAMSLGHLFSKHRAAASVILYVAVGAALSAAVTALCRLAIRSNMFTALWGTAATTAQESMSQMSTAMLVGLGLLLAGSAILWFVNRYILKNHLNLE